jgi:2-oxoglutarate ferredoxin oxidoreductase subunit alpha
MTKRIESTNDFVIKFANSQRLGLGLGERALAKSFLRMGIPVSPRNIFPSNIQGLPTWYEVRVTESATSGAAAAST